MKIYNFAKQYISKGISLYPVKNNSKQAAIRWREFMERHPTEKEIFSWFKISKFENLAIITGRISGLIVIDCDDDMAIAMWEYICQQNNTPECFSDTIQVPTKRGKHFYYKYPEGKMVRSVPNHFGKYVKIEIRSEGCSVKAPPSKFVDSTGEYRFEPNKTLLDFPLWLAEELEPEKQFIQTSGANGNTWLEKALAKAKIGNRNFACVWLADQLRDDGVPIQTAEKIVQEFAKRVPEGTTYTTEEALATLHSRYRKPKREPAKRK